MDLDTFLSTVEAWEKGDKAQRLGQCLINKMEPPVTDPEIFYETNHRLASFKFFDKYILQETTHEEHVS